MIYSRNGWYHCDFMVDGKRYRLALATRDKRKAKDLEKDKVAEAKQGKLTATSIAFARLPFSEAADRYMTDREPHLAPRTISTERERVKPLKAFFGNAKLRAIGPDQVRQYIARRKAAGLANKTINLELELVRGILKRAKRWHAVSDEIRMLPANHDAGRAMEQDEKLRLLKVAASNPNWQVAKCATILALNTTMRKCEIRGLQWKRINLIDRALTVWRKTTKTDGGERVIPLNDDSLGAILEMRERAKTFLGDDISPDWFVFFRHEGFTSAPDPTRPMGVTGWRTAWRAMTRTVECPKCGQGQLPIDFCRNPKCKAEMRGIKSPLAGLRFHDLRHHCITELAEGQASDMTIMSIAGHVSKKMLEHYSHTRMDAKRRAIESLSSTQQTDQSGQFLRQNGGGYVTDRVTNASLRPATRQ
jgi:integrase